MLASALSHDKLAQDALVSAFELKNIAQLLLIEPKRYLDCRSLSGISQKSNGDECCLAAVALGTNNNHSRKGTVRVDMQDQAGTPFNITVGIDSPLLKQALKDKRAIYLHGRVDKRGGTTQLKQAILVTKLMRGRIIPVVPGIPKKIYQDEANQVLEVFYGSFVNGNRTISSLLPLWKELWTIPCRLRKLIYSKHHFDSSERLIRSMTERTDAESYRQAIKCCRMLNIADYLYSQNLANLRHRGMYQPQIISKKAISKAISRLEDSYVLTDCQKCAVSEICDDLATSKTGNGLLNGDVGTGKSLVIAAVALAAHYDSKAVMILAPNIGIVDQLVETIERLDRTATTEGYTASACQRSSGDSASIMIGTTALVNRHGSMRPDILIIDEEQQFGAKQKYALCGSNTYQLLASATCIPATVAMSTLGYRRIFNLKTRFSNRQVKTFLHSPDNIQPLKQAVDKTIESDNQLLVVLPVSKRKEGKYLDSLSVDKVYSDWQLSYPGKVVCLTGDMPDSETKNTLSQIKEGNAQIIIATSVTECGLNIPNLTHVIGVEPARFGARQLHQIRGRAGRYGQESRFDLLPITPLSDKARERLSLLTKYDDGYKIAENELELRGFGSLSYNELEQSGRPEHLIKRRHITPAEVRYVAAQLQDNEVDYEI